MITFRIIAEYQGKTIVGNWQRDVPYYLVEYCKIWIGREANFHVEFKESDPA